MPRAARARAPRDAPAAGAAAAATDSIAEATGAEGIAAGEVKGRAARGGSRQRKSRGNAKRTTRVHTALEVPKSNFVGFVTTFEYEVFAVVWQRVLDALMKEG
jgi:hypothetical protein